MLSLKLLKRPSEGVVVVRDAGASYPPNDTDDDRPYSVGEQIHVRLDCPEPLRQDSLHADVVDVDEYGIVARARHSVFRADEHGLPFGGPVVRSGDDFIAPRNCIFAVTKASATSQVVQVPFTIPPGIKTLEDRLKLELQALIAAALRVVDCAVSKGAKRDIVPSKDVRVLRRIAERAEYRLRGGDI